jgi:hypothetical protein
VELEFRYNMMLLDVTSINLKMLSFAYFISIVLGRWIRWGLKIPPCSKLGMTEKVWEPLTYSDIRLTLSSYRIAVGPFFAAFILSSATERGQVLPFSSMPLTEASIDTF